MIPQILLSPKLPKQTLFAAVSPRLNDAVVHVTNQSAPTTIGDNVTVGHSAVIHGCTVRDRVLVGMGAIILDHADIGSDSIIGAGALITEVWSFRHVPRP